MNLKLLHDYLRSHDVIVQKCGDITIALALFKTCTSQHTPLPIEEQVEVLPLFKIQQLSWKIQTQPSSQFALQQPFQRLDEDKMTTLISLSKTMGLPTIKLNEAFHIMLEDAALPH